MKKILIILLSLILLLAGCTRMDEWDGEINTPAPSQGEASAVPQATSIHQNNVPAQKDRIYGSDKVGMYNFVKEPSKYNVFNISLETKMENDYLDTAVFEIEFLLPAGWYCLREPIELELYLGATEGDNCKLFDSRVWIYDNTDVCVGAIGIKRSNVPSGERMDSSEDVHEFYASINSDTDYCFITDEYYFSTAKSIMQSENHFEANAITEVLYTTEYLASFGKIVKNDRMNMAILSKKPNDNVYVCMEIFSGRLNFAELMDIARSINWSGWS